jgi:hypothetical protein
MDPFTSSGAKHSLALPCASSDEKRRKLEQLNQGMGRYGVVKLLALRSNLLVASGDASQHLAEVLISLTEELESANIGGNVMPPLLLKEARMVVANLGNDELKDLKSEVKKCVESENWSSLASSQRK